MRGQLQMATGELGFLTLYVPDDRSGQRPLRRQPELRRHARQRRAPAASIKLSGAELDLYQLNLALRALEMEARIVSNNLEFSSTANAGAGTLASSGQDRVARQACRTATSALDGENLRVVDVPEARIDASPGSRLPHRRPRDPREGRGQTTAGAHPARRPHQCRAAVGRRRCWSGPRKQVEKDPFLRHQRNHA